MKQKIESMKKLLIAMKNDCRVFDGENWQKNQRRERELDKMIEVFNIEKLWENKKDSK